jgi:hypothetical protein
VFSDHQQQVEAPPSYQYDTPLGLSQQQQQPPQHYQTNPTQGEGSLLGASSLSSAASGTGGGSGGVGNNSSDIWSGGNNEGHFDGNAPFGLTVSDDSSREKGV